MAKRNLNWTQDKYNRFLKEGRGQGEGINYKPWWTIQDFPSYGRVSRINGWTTKRIHHFFSDIETNFFYLTDWETDIVDIKEHYPLLDFNEIVDDVSDLRLDKFTDKDSGEQYVITTTFLLTVRSNKGNHKYVARSIKGSSELQKPLSIERLELEKRYWESKRINWGIVTEHEIPICKAKNIEWVHSSLRNSEEFGISKRDREYYSEVIKERFNSSFNTIRDELGIIDKKFNLEYGTSIYIFKYLIASKVIEIINLNEKIDIGKRITDVVLKVNDFGGNEHELSANY